MNPIQDGAVPSTAARAHVVRGVAALAAALLVAGCSAPPMARLGAKAPTAVKPVGEVESYKLGKSNLKFEADVRAANAYTISFPGVSGTFDLSPQKPEASSFEVDIQTASAEASWSLVADIARDHFLHVGAHPKARFASTALRKNPKGGYTLYGNLSFHGTTKSLATPAELTIGRCRVALGVEFSIDRHAFGAVSEGSLESVVSDTVVIRIRADLPRAGAGEACKATEKASVEPATSSSG